MWIAASLATALLLIERLAYIFVWRHPEHFRKFCARGLVLGQHDPVDALRTLFVVFKFIQIGVFIGWFMHFGESFPPLPTASWPVILAGIFLFVFGQALNLSVFWRLGKVGVFYGNRLGHRVPWVEGFPFSIVPHPQYLGTLISIWGLFLIMRHPHPDWVVLPLISTVLYLAAMRLESSVTDS
ncbi:MAG: hypothetical protein EA370_02470 [Wenzhouxiangella sp.]|nr:MAG: hypothetical protein EA370_02470 [Wenzhouxiangella sp.]